MGTKIHVNVRVATNPESSGGCIYGYVEKAHDSSGDLAVGFVVQW
jgi:hypothetical protein